MQSANQQEITIDINDEYLFEERIEAWVYGPAVPDVYREKSILSFFDENLFCDRAQVKEVVDNIIQDTLEIGDFRLVDISHLDKAWINNFNYDDIIHDREINKEEIIDEYSKK